MLSGAIVLSSSLLLYIVLLYITMAREQCIITQCIEQLAAVYTHTHSYGKGALCMRIDSMCVLLCSAVVREHYIVAHTVRQEQLCAISIVCITIHYYIHLW